MIASCIRAGDLSLVLCRTIFERIPRKLNALSLRGMRSKIVRHNTKLKSPARMHEAIIGIFLCFPMKQNKSRKCWRNRIM